METILKLDDVNVTYVNKEKEVYAVRNASFSIVHWQYDIITYKADQ